MILAIFFIIKLTNAVKDGILIRQQSRNKGVSRDDKTYCDNHGRQRPLG